MKRNDHDLAKLACRESACAVLDQEGVLREIKR